MGFNSAFKVLSLHLSSFTKLFSLNFKLHWKLGKLFLVRIPWQNIPEGFGNVTGVSRQWQRAIILCRRLLQRSVPPRLERRKCNKSLGIVTLQTLLHPTTPNTDNVRVTWINCLGVLDVRSAYVGMNSPSLYSCFNYKSRYNIGINFQHRVCRHLVHYWLIPNDQLLHAMLLYMKVADSCDIKKQFIYVRLFTNFVIRFLIPVLSPISTSALPT